MPSKPVLYKLFDIRDNAHRAQKWTAGQTPESFKVDEQTFFAVTRALEIVSEATRHLPQEMRDRHPELPWRAIMDVGNVYRHEYDNVSEDAVWRTVHERLPALLAMIEMEIVLYEQQAAASVEPGEAPKTLPERDHEPDIEP